MDRSLVDVLNRLFPNPRYYGWIVVGTGFLCSALSSPGQSFAIALYLDSLMNDLSVSSVQISMIYAVATLAAAAILPFVGGLADRFPARWFLGLTIAFLGIAMAGFAHVEGVAGLAASFVAIRLLGQGSIGLGTLTTVVLWFRRYRGRALAVVSLGFALGQLVFPAAIYTLIERADWRLSLLVFAGLYLFVFAPFVAWVLRERRPDEPVDGGAAAPDAPTIDPEGTGGRDPEFTLGETVRMRVFWGMLVCAIVSPLVMTGVTFHQVALFESIGWEVALVPPAFMAFAIGGVIMTYLTGLLLERVPTRYGVATSLALIVLAFATTLVPLPDAIGAILYGFVLGLASGAVAASNSMVWPTYFGVASLGQTKGIVQAARNGATAVGPPVAAILASATATYETVLVLFGGLAIAGAAFALVLKPPSHPDRAREAYDSAGADLAAD